MWACTLSLNGFDLQRLHATSCKMQWPRVVPVERIIFFVCTHSSNLNLMGSVLDTLPATATRQRNRLWEQSCTLSFESKRLLGDAIKANRS